MRELRGASRDEQEVSLAESLPDLHNIVLRRRSDRTNEQCRE
ncbi:MAG: hypothetical protein AB7K24_04105 [Gemmataceae bacterium]